jgi:hypothetical protein
MIKAPVVFGFTDAPEIILRSVAVVDLKVPTLEELRHAGCPTFWIPEVIGVEEVHQQEATRVQVPMDVAEERLNVSVRFNIDDGKKGKSKVKALR